MSKAFSLPQSFSVVACLLFSAVLLAAVSIAGAGTFTYDIVNYPEYQTDSITGGTDTLSGTIITDSDSGTLTPADFVGGTIYITNPVLGTFSMPVLSAAVRN